VFYLSEQEAAMTSKLMVPPHNLEAEEAILGGILLNNDAMTDVMDILGADDFYGLKNQKLFQGMIELYGRDETIDLITLPQHLKEKKPAKKRDRRKQDFVENEDGLDDYLASLAEAVSTSAGIKYHAGIVKNYSVKRQLMAEASNIFYACFEEWKETDALLDQAEQGIFNILERKTNTDFRPFLTVIKENVTKIEESSKNPGAVTGVSTGFADFDRLTAGLQPSDLIIIAGRPSMGKTALALNIGYNVARTGTAVAVYSLEMTDSQLGMRLLSLDSGISGARLRNGILMEGDYGRLVNAANNLSDMPVYIDDTAGNNVLDIKAKTRRLMRKAPVGLVIIDYLQLMNGSAGKRGGAESRQIEVSEISRGLKGLAKDLDVPVIALSQLNRMVENREDKRPRLADLRESGAIEQDADVIAFIYRDEVYNEHTEDGNIAEIILAKQRNGETGSFKLYFRKELTAFGNFIQQEGH